MDKIKNEKKDKVKKLTLFQIDILDNQKLCFEGLHKARRVGVYHFSK
jgi:hypothetical protein